MKLRGTSPWVLASLVIMAMAGCAEGVVAEQGTVDAMVDAGEVMPDVVVDAAPDLAPEVTPGGDAAPDLEDVTEETTPEVLEDVAEEVIQAFPCVPGVAPEDPCWYCKCNDDGTKKCFALGASTSCPSDDCCVTNATCQPCAPGGDEPCPASQMQCTGPATIPCNVEGDCSDDTAVCLGGLCVCQSQPLAEGTACVMDPNFCTEGDTCQDGTCSPGTPVETDDGNPCTTPLCVKGVVYQVPIDGPCSDQNPCTMNDQCAGGVCVSGPPVTCQLAPCDQDGVCKPAQGCVLTPKPIGASCSPIGGDGCGTCQQGGWCQTTGSSCYDGNVCTSAICLPDGGCEFVANDLLCDDGDPCTWGDKCADKVCQPGIEAVCNDLNPCTDDVCVKGSCVSTVNEEPCDDDNVCTQEDTCSVALPPCPGPFGSPLVLHHVYVQPWQSLVRYSKDANVCGHIISMDGTLLHPPDLFCLAAECVDLEIPGGVLSVALGDMVMMCHGDDYTFCSEPVVVDQPSGSGFCTGVDVTAAMCDDDNPCTNDICHEDTGCAHVSNLTCGDYKLAYDDTVLTQSAGNQDCAEAMVHFDCPPGSVAIGTQGTNGEGFDSLALACAHLEPDGSLSTETATGSLGDVSTGVAFGPASCPGSQVLVGSLTYVDEGVLGLLGLCHPAPAVVTQTPGFTQQVPLVGKVTAESVGQPCPPGYVLTGMEGPLNSTVCAVTWQCTRMVKD